MVHKQTSEPNDSFSGKNIVCVCKGTDWGKKTTSLSSVDLKCASYTRSEQNVGADITTSGRCSRDTN